MAMSDDERKLRNRQSKKKWRDTNAERQRVINAECSRRRREAHPESEKLRRLSRRDETLAYQAKWRAANREKLVASRAKPGHKALVRACQLRRYGLTVGDYQAMFDLQAGLCAICQAPEGARNRSLAVDHCHSTGKVRALLCSGCNAMLGMAKENILTLLAAIAYLRADYGSESVEE